MKLLIIGQGYLYDTLHAQIIEQGLEGQVELLGLRKDVSRLLAASDLYVNSSLWEGLSIAMLEAMAAGLPVVGTRVGDAPQVVVDGTGCLTQPGRPDELADALGSFLADPEKMRLAGVKARQHVIAHHDPQVWADRILDVYRDAMTPAGSVAQRSAS